MVAMARARGARVGAGVCAMALFAGACGVTGSESADLTFTVGRQPYAAGNSPITQYMMENNLVEEAASDLGVDADITYLDYPSAGPQVEAMIGDRLDFGMWGNTPIIQSMAQNQPVSVISAGEGNLRFVLLTERGSGIQNMEDLEGKTVGLLLGGDPHLAFIGMLEQELGLSDPAEVGIELVNLPTQAVGATVPKGVDATIVGYPAVLKQQEVDDDVVGVLNSHGYTEDGYVGPSGEGGGIELPSLQGSTFAPEGFYGHRSFWMARDELIENNPKVVEAFLRAQQEAVQALTEQEPETVANSVQEYWDLTAENGARVLDDEIILDRGWAWATESDAQLLMKLSILMAENDIIDRNLEWKEVVDGFAPSSEIVRRAYDSVGAEPPSSEFDATQGDQRGAPQWQLDAWTAPG